MLLFLLTDNNFRNITLPNAANIFRLKLIKSPHPNSLALSCLGKKDLTRHLDPLMSGKGYCVFEMALGIVIITLQIFSSKIHLKVLSKRIKTYRSDRHCFL